VVIAVFDTRAAKRTAAVTLAREQTARLSRSRANADRRHL